MGRSKGFTKVPNSFLDNPDLTCIEKWIIQQFHSNSENYEPSVTALRALCAETKEAITKAIKSLQSKGYLIQQKLRRNGKWVYRYKFAWKPIFNGDNNDITATANTGLDKQACMPRPDTAVVTKEHIEPPKNKEEKDQNRYASDAPKRTSPATLEEKKNEQPEQPNTPKQIWKRTSLGEIIPAEYKDPNFKDADFILDEETIEQISTLVISTDKPHKWGAHYTFTYRQGIPVQFKGSRRVIKAFISNHTTSDNYIWFEDGSRALGGDLVKDGMSISYYVTHYDGELINFEDYLDSA